MMRIILIVALGAIMQAAQEFAPAAATGSAPAATILSIGFLLLTAFLVGTLFKQVGLPKLTGYLGAGIVVGPHVLHLVTDPMVVNLQVFNGAAVALIALTAGTEMHLQSMRPLMKTIAWLSFWCVIGTAAVLTATAYLARDLLPFMQGLTTTQALAVSAVLAVTMTAKSPAVVVALKDETQADGPMVRTVMGAVVTADLLVIVLFAGVSSVTQGIFGAQTDALATARQLSWELFGSLAAGVLVGLAITAFMRRVATSGALFIVAVAFVTAEVGRRVLLDPLIVSLAAGVFIRNATDVAGRLRRDVEQASLPVYVVFFAVAGATIHIDVLASLGPIAGLFVLTRAATFVAGAKVAAVQAGTPREVARWLSFGLMPQAGLALALALLFARTFPQFGTSASALVFGVVALNELIAPVLFRLALVKSGEAGAGTSSSGVAH